MQWIAILTSSEKSFSCKKQKNVNNVTRWHRMFTSGHWALSGQHPWGWGGAGWPSEQRTSAHTIFWQNSLPDLATATKLIWWRHVTLVEQILTFNNCHFPQEEWQSKGLHVFTSMWLGNNWGSRGVKGSITCGWPPICTIAGSICAGFPLEIFSGC